MTPWSRRRWLQAGPLGLALGCSRNALGQGSPITRTPRNFRLVGAPVVQRECTPSTAR
jgi:hypothetical protein